MAENTSGHFGANTYGSGQYGGAIVASEQASVQSQATTTATAHTDAAEFVSTQSGRAVSVSTKTKTTESTTTDTTTHQSLTDITTALAETSQISASHTVALNHTSTATASPDHTASIGVTGTDSTTASSLSSQRSGLTHSLTDFADAHVTAGSRIVATARVLELADAAQSESGSVRITASTLGDVHSTARVTDRGGLTGSAQNTIFAPAIAQSGGTATTGRSVFTTDTAGAHSVATNATGLSPASVPHSTHTFGTVDTALQPLTPVVRDNTRSFESGRSRTPRPRPDLTDSGVVRPHLTVLGETTIAETPTYAHADGSATQETSTTYNSTEWSHTNAYSQRTVGRLTPTPGDQTIATDSGSSTVTQTTRANPHGPAGESPAVVGESTFTTIDHGRATVTPDTVGTSVTVVEQETTLSKENGATVASQLLHTGEQGRATDGTTITSTGTPTVTILARAHADPGITSTPSVYTTESASADERAHSIRSVVPDTHSTTEAFASAQQQTPVQYSVTTFGDTQLSASAQARSTVQTTAHGYSTERPASIQQIESRTVERAHTVDSGTAVTGRRVSPLFETTHTLDTAVQLAPSAVTTQDTTLSTDSGRASGSREITLHEDTARSIEAPENSATITTRGATYATTVDSGSLVSNTAMRVIVNTDGSVLSQLSITTPTEQRATTRGLTSEAPSVLYTGTDSVIDHAGALDIPTQVTTPTTVVGSDTARVFESPQRQSVSTVSARPTAHATELPSVGGHIRPRTDTKTRAAGKISSSIGPEYRSLEFGDATDSTTQQTPLRSILITRAGTQARPNTVTQGRAIFATEWSGARDRPTVLPDSVYDVTPRVITTELGATRLSVTVPLTTRIPRLERTVSVDGALTDTTTTPKRRIRTERITNSSGRNARVLSEDRHAVIETYGVDDNTIGTDS